MADIKQVKLIDLIPNSIRGEPQIQAAADAIDQELHAVTTALLETIIIPRISELHESVLDLLAWHLHVDFYEPVGMSIDKKRAMIKQSIVWHRHKGTPWAVEQVVSAAFDESEVIEWFQYGGLPYHFKIKTTDINSSPDHLASIRRAVSTTKNTRSYLDAIEFFLHFIESEQANDHEVMLTIDQLFADRYSWRGRKFDGGWHYTAPAVYGGAWNLDGQQRYDGALGGDDDPIIAGSRFDSTWRLDGSKTFVLANPTRKVSFSTEEPEELYTTPVIGQSDTHGVVLLFDGASRKMDGLQKFGAMNGPQDANDVILAPVLSQADDMETTEAMAMQTDFPMRDNYPLPRLQYFSGAWAFGQGVTHDGRLWFGSGEKYDGLPGLPDPAVKPILLDGQNRFDGATVLGAPQPAVIFGADAEAADTVALDVQLTAAETVSTAEAVSVTAIGILEDFAYADVRLDGSYRFAQPACFDGFWQQRGAQFYDGVAIERAGNLPEPEPLAGTYNGQSVYNGGADAAYDGTFGFNTYPTTEQVARFNGRAMQDNENISLNLAMQDAVRHTAPMDGAAMFDGSWDVDEQPGFYEQEQDEITIGRWFGGGWQFDAGNTLLLGGAWNFDGTYLHNILGSCRDHFNGSLTMDGTTVFWKGGETFEHYRYAAN